MAAPMNFQLDTSNYLGFQYENFLNDLQALAISEPKKYYTMRKAVLDIAKNKVVRDVYTQYYSLLTTGEIGGSNPISDVMGVSPNYPSQDASKFSLECAKTINSMLEKCLEIILPASHLDVAELRIKKKHLTDNIEA